MNNYNTPEVQEALRHVYDQTDLALVIDCPPDEHLVTGLTSALYDATDNPFRITHHPQVDNSSPEPTSIHLVANRLEWDRDVGWVRSDTPSRPQVELTGLRSFDNTDDLVDALYDAMKIAIH